MECHQIHGIQGPKAGRRIQAHSPVLHDSLATEVHSGITKGNTYRESPLASSTSTSPEVTSFPVKSSGSFYGQPSWTSSEAWSFENTPASSTFPFFDTPNASRSHRPKTPSSTQQTSSTKSGNSELFMIDSRKICSLSSKETTLPHPNGGLGKKEKEKETKLGKMYKRASKSTKAISRLLFHSPGSASVAKCSSLKLPLPLVVPPEEDNVVDPFASGKSVASYGLSPVETSSPLNHQRTQSFPTSRSSLAVGAGKPPLLRSPSVSSSLDTSDSPSPRKSNQLLEGQNIRGRKISFPLRVGNLTSTSWPPPVHRARANSMSATRFPKVFHDHDCTSPPMPPIFQATTSTCPSAPDDLTRLFPLPPHISLPKSVTHPQAKSVSQTKSEFISPPTEAVSYKGDNRSCSSISDRMRPLPPIPMRADSTPVAQAQTQLFDVNSEVDMKQGSKTLVVASSPSTLSLEGGNITSPRDASAGISGQRRRARSITKYIGPVHEPQSYPKSESVARAHVSASGSVPPVASNGVSECTSRRRGSNSSGYTSPSPSFQQHRSAIKPSLPPLSTKFLSPPANPGDSKSISGSLGSVQCRLPRSPSLPELRHGSAEAPLVPKLGPNPRSDDLRGLLKRVHVRSPSLPTLSRDSRNMPRPQALPIWIVDRLKSRGRDFSRPTRRLSSTDSASSTKPPSLVSNRATFSGSNYLIHPPTHASNHSESDSGSETLSYALIYSKPPSVAHERKPTPGAITSASPISNTHVLVRPSVPSIQSSALKVQPPHSPTTPLLRRRRCLKSPSMPNLRARVTASAVASSDGRSQPSFSPIPRQIRDAPSPSHSQFILVPPIPPIPDSYKLQTPTSAKPTTAPPFNATFLRSRPDLTRLNEFSYPSTKMAGKPFHVCSNKELEKEDNMDSMHTPPRSPRSFSMMIPSSPLLHRRRMSYGSKSISVKGQGGDIPPVPPLPSSTPKPALPAPRMRNVPLHDKLTVGAAF